MTKIKIGLFGFGVVGQGIYEVVRKSKNAHAEIVKICVRDPKKPRKIEVDPSLFTTSVDDILDNQNINLVVEVIDDADAAVQHRQTGHAARHPGRVGQQDDARQATFPS